mmetsp:Transcript_16999/g.26448  ORF Transcript_16999/g.26448 Transcript_16999/m.26448 type:complete len:242 (+) Transcript_16999:1005-1730(+)
MLEKHERSFFDATKIHNIIRHYIFRMFLSIEIFGTQLQHFPFIDRNKLQHFFTQRLIFGCDIKCFMRIIIFIFDAELFMQNAWRLFDATHKLIIRRKSMRTTQKLDAFPFLGQKTLNRLYLQRVAQHIARFLSLTFLVLLVQCCHFWRTQRVAQMVRVQKIAMHHVHNLFHIDLLAIVVVEIGQRIMSHILLLRPIAMIANQTFTANHAIRILFAAFTREIAINLVKLVIVDEVMVVIEQH